MRRTSSSLLLAAFVVLAAGTPSFGRNESLRVVPDLGGRTSIEAYRMLAAQDLLGPESGTVTPGPLDVVDEQSPAAGAVVSRWNTVRVSYRPGPAGERPSVTVPALGGLTAAGAASVLRMNLLVPDLRWSEWPDRPVERVWSQLPGSGRSVPPGSVVRAYVQPAARGSYDSRFVTRVPPLRGLTRAQAERLVAEAGLAGPTWDAPPTADASTWVVDTQTPAAATLVGAGILVRVTWRVLAESADRIGTTSVPSVLGFTGFDARAAISAAFLLPDVSFRRSPDRPVDNRVVDQVPAPGTVVARATRVRIVVNGIGFVVSPAPMLVPSLRDQTLSEASATLRAVGMTLSSAIHETNERGGRPTRIVRWSPTTAAAGAAIEVWIQDEGRVPPAGDGTVAVPNLQWLTRGQAEGALLERGLRLGRIFYGYSPTPGTPAGVVWKQDPAAGLRLRPVTGRDVFVWLNTTIDAPRGVPNVVGMTRDEAVRVLGANSFSVDLHGPAGIADALTRVTEQSPTNGSAAVRWTVVRVTFVAERFVPVPVPGRR